MYACIISPEAGEAATGAHPAAAPAPPWHAVGYSAVPPSCYLYLQSYPEFCRATFDTASKPVMEAVVEMERRYGKVRLEGW